MGRGETILVSWLGRSDLRAGYRQQWADEPGPVVRLAQYLKPRLFKIYLLNDILPNQVLQDEVTAEAFAKAVSGLLGLEVELFSSGENLKNDFARAYEFTRDRIAFLRKQYPGSPFAFALSSGYPAAQVAMLVAASMFFDRGQVAAYNTYPARDPHDAGVEKVDLDAFSLSMDVVPSVLRRWAEDYFEPPGEAFDRILGESRAIVIAKQLARRFANSDLNLLLWGESGTGKELFARAIHDSSDRKDHEFVAINCAGLPESLLESELFGYVKGAFTGAISNREGFLEKADGGTLFLDEIGDMPMPMQAKLLRVLQEQKFTPVGSTEERDVNVRVIAATHRDLQEMVRQGLFRHDLLFRLNGFTITIPPLRERGNDLRLLAERLLREYNHEYGCRKEWSEAALARLRQHHWPGNVRELQVVVKRAAILSLGDVIERDVVEMCLERPSQPREKPLSLLSEYELFQLAGALVDETIRRFQTPASWPISETCGAERSLIKDFWEPLVFGRALRAAEDVWSRAGKLIQKSEFERGNTSDRRRVEFYEKHLKSWLNERDIAAWRGESE